MDACVNCGHESMMPFYQGYRMRRFRYFTKDLVCPKCKSVMCTDMDGMTEEEKEARQVGKPCLHGCGVPYRQSYEYGTKQICKSCGKSWNVREAK